jgi:hypothetical protein
VTEPFPTAEQHRRCKRWSITTIAAASISHPTSRAAEPEAAVLAPVLHHTFCLTVRGGPREGGELSTGGLAFPGGHGDQWERRWIL